MLRRSNCCRLPSLAVDPRWSRLTCHANVDRNESRIFWEPLMTKALLALLLVMTQLLSWSGPALWLCICGSGETCIVGDPQTCNCCHGHHPQGTPCGAAEACDDDQPLASDRFHSGRDDLRVCEPSGCPHFQLSHHQAAAVASAKFADETARFIAVIVNPASIADGSVRDCATLAFWLPRAPRLSLTGLAHVVLRC